MAIKTFKETVPHGYQIIGDNLDLQVNVKHMSNENKNKSIHTFNMIATADDVSGDHLPDYHKSTLQDANVSDFLSSPSDIASLKRDFIPL